MPPSRKRIPTPAPQHQTEPDFVRATRASYDAVAADYVEHIRDLMSRQPWDRAMLATFAELVRAAGGGRVADLGCGPGRVAAHLHTLGLDVFGIDLSPQMIALARRSYPGLRFEVGTMAALDLPDGALAGIVAWYSVIHTPPDLLPRVFAEFVRVLTPGGHALLAFQVGDEPLRRTEAFGRSVSLTFHRLRPDRVAELLRRAGLTVRAQLVREPEAYPDRVEPTPQAYLLARKADQAKGGSVPTAEAP